jgi:hypothetical protein
MEISGQLYASAALAPEKETPVPIGQETGWPPEPVLSLCDRENDSCPFRETNPVHPARSSSLYRLRFHGSIKIKT